MVNIFKKLGRNIGSIFKKIDPFQALGSIAGSTSGSLAGAAIGEAVAPEGGPISADIGGLIGGQIGSIIGGSAGKRYSEHLSNIRHHHAGTPVRPKIGDVITTDQRRVDTHTFKVMDTKDQAKRMKDMGVRPVLGPSKQKFISGVPTPKKFLDGVPTPQPYIKRPPKEPSNELEKAKPIRDKKEQLFV